MSKFIDNSGKCNSGNRNSGNYNSGNRNSGSYNSGSYNSGHYNSGNLNSGDYNSGHYNSGKCNSGNRNSGDSNSGNYNSGHYNSGNRNSGFFCTNTPGPLFFDLPCSLSWEEAIMAVPDVQSPLLCDWVPFEELTEEEKNLPIAKTAGGVLRETKRSLRDWFPEYWASGKISYEAKNAFKALPNFDPEKFYQITGVDLREKPIAAKEENVVRIQLSNGQVIEVVGKVI